MGLLLDRGGPVLHEKLEELCARLEIGQDSFRDVDILVLPENVESRDSAGELFDSDDSVFLAKEMKAQGIACKTAFDLGKRPKVMDRRGDDIWLGIIWILNEIAAPSISAFLSEWITRKLSQFDRKRDSQETNTGTIHVGLRIQDGERTSCLDFDGTANDFQLVLSALKGRKPRRK